MKKVGNMHFIGMDDIDGVEEIGMAKLYPSTVS